jgi:hypothetical protein
MQNRPMNYWLIKGRPDENGQFVGFFKPGRRARWHASRFTSDLRAGDRVIFWASVWRRVVAAGEITNPKLEVSGKDVTYGVRYLSGLVPAPSPNIEELRTDPRFAEAEFLKAGPARSIFALKPVQGRYLFNWLLDADRRASRTLAAPRPSSGEPIGRVFERLLRVLADAICTAHEIAPQGWCLTASKHRIRLNVGTIEVMTIADRTLHLLIRGAANTKKPLYRSVPDARPVDLGESEVLDQLPRLRRRHAVLVRTAARNRGFSIWSESHSPEALAYLERELKCRLPSPGSARPAKSSMGASAAGAIAVPELITGGLMPPPKTAAGSSQRTARRVSPEQWQRQDEERRRRGRKAEETAIDWERNRLRQQGITQPDALKDCSEYPGLGYDLLSRERDGERRYIEVKAASGSPKRFSFLLTANERQKSRSLPNYHFYLVFDPDGPKPHVLDVPARRLTGASIEPDTYLVRAIRTERPAGVLGRSTPRA